MATNSTRSRGALSVKARHYRSRIAHFASRLEQNSVAIIVSNPEQTRSNDTEYPYRQSSDILYLNGFAEPSSVLVISNIGRSRAKVIMFVQPKDQMREQWTGIRAGVEGAKAHYLAHEAHPIDQFEKVLAKLLASAEHVYYKHKHNAELDERFNKVWLATPRTLHNPEEILHEMRMFKSPQEIALIQEAARISAQAHTFAALRCRPGMKEYQLQATMEQIFTDNGAMAPAYGSIVAGGPRGWVLHYVANQGTLEDGEMVLIDAACEYKGYAADITRTFPVNGSFTSAQATIYQLVLDAQLAAIKAAKPGASLRRVHLTAAAVLRRGLIKLGLLGKEMATRKGEAKLAKQAKADGKTIVTLSTFFPHGTSHWMGLDVHDVATSGTRSDKGKSRKLKPGMVFTVEPGLYFAGDDTRVPPQYRGIAVRIEDDVLVTKDGCLVLTSAMPKAIDEIEALMKLS